MKYKLCVFSNDKVKKFLKTFFSQYELTFMKLEDTQHDLLRANANIIIVNNNNDFDLLNFENLNENYLIISNLKNKILNTNKNVKLLKAPQPINKIKTTVENFMLNLKIQFHNISIDNEKLINLKNNSFCYLTKIEQEILNYLISEKAASKKFIKENILNIKSNIKTNSLESHLSRIRKKISKVSPNVKILTKNENLMITI